LGSSTTDVSGNISATINVPDNVPTGYHTLHVYGTNIAGEPVDIYKTVYVAANESDYDGDGVNNVTDACLIIEPSGQDIDQDGIDDSCDGDIGEPPVIVPPIVVEEPPTPELPPVIDEPPVVPELPHVVDEPTPEPEPPLVVIDETADTEAPVVVEEPTTPSLPPVITNPEPPLVVIDTPPVVSEEQPPAQDNTENPQTTDSPLETKPPENNPETEASPIPGSETIQIATSSTSLVSSSSSPTILGTSEQISPITPPTPKVAAATTEHIQTTIRPADAAPKAPNPANHRWLFAILGLIPLSLLAWLAKPKP
jgi:hypothetical protein